MTERAASDRPLTTIRWVLTHEPIALFEEAAKRFQELVREGSHGALEVKVETPTEYGEGTRAKPLDVARDVASGKLQMSQTYTTVLGQLADRLWALDMPFLFRSHEHAAHVLDGRIGGRLLRELEPSGLTGLAFTYSGGYRILSSTERAIESIDDLRGLRVRTSHNPVVTALFEGLGAKPVPAPLWEIPALTEAGAIDAAESTWPRYWDMEHQRAQPIVNETSHSLFLTALVINQDFFRSLSDAHQAVLMSSALEVARLERAKSVHDGDVARAEHIAQGGQVHTLSRHEAERFERAARFVRERFGSRFGDELLTEIVQAAFAQAG